MPTENKEKAQELLRYPIEFTADGAKVTSQKEVSVSASRYSLKGTYLPKEVEQCYLLNDASDGFEKSAAGKQVSINPFGAWMTSLMIDELSPEKLSLAKYSTAGNTEDPNDNPSTGIESVNTTPEGKAVAYNIQGQAFRVEIINGKPNLTQLPRGMYIVKGKKYVR